MDVATAVTRPQSFWASVREALRGGHHDYTETEISRAIFLLAIPMVLEMSMESLFGLVDIYFVAHLGADAPATVALTESLLTMVFAIAMGLSMAATAMVARRVGEKDIDGACVAGGQAILIGVAISVVIGFIGITFGSDMLRLMGASPSMMAIGHNFPRIELGGSITIILLFLNNAIFRGAGDAAIAMRALWISNAVNIVLDPCLIRGLGPFPEMGVTGAATATTIGRGIGVLYQLHVLFRGGSSIRLRRRHLTLDMHVMRRLLSISRDGMFQYFVATASWLGLVRLIATFGSAALAGYNIALRVIIFAILPSWGLSNAAATLVGQNLGARKPDRAEAAVWRTGLYNMVFLGIVAVIFIVFARPILLIITNEEPVLAYGIDCLRYVSYGYVFYAWGMVMVQAFNGAGDTRTPTLINLACYWMWQIPLAYVLCYYTDLGARGAFLAITIAESTLAVAGILAFRRGRWKNQKV